MKVASVDCLVIYVTERAFGEVRLFILHCLSL